MQQQPSQRSLKPQQAFRADTSTVCCMLLLMLMVGGLSFMGALLGTLYAHDMGLETLGKVMGGGGEVREEVQQQQQSGAVADAPAASGGGSREALPAAQGSLDFDARVRRQWKDLTQTICPRRNYTSCRSIDRSGWTDAAKSQLCPLAFAGIGAWSTFKIASHNSKGEKKTKGGDFLVMEMRDAEQKIRSELTHSCLRPKHEKEDWGVNLLLD